MATLTIDETQYDIDETNEDQVRAYNELLANQNIQQQLDYQLAVLKERSGTLVNILKGLLVTEEDGDGEDK
tara:strand:+ start:67 stop:279 length:213 start_codon:yes stop_codon:yes gene_type:complete